MAYALSPIDAAIRRQGVTWPTAVAMGVAIAAVALLIRVAVPGSIAGNQAIFSYPAIVIATLFYGARAGSVAGILCFPFLWYYVVPPRWSFAIDNWPGTISLAMYLMVGAVLIWAIAHLRFALQRYQALNVDLEAQVERRTSERNRLWQRSRELLAIVTSDGGLQACNPALSHLAGLDDAASKGRSFESLLVADDRPRYRAAALAGAGIFEARLLTAAQPAWVAWSIAPGDGESYLIGRDFTAEHECGEQLRQSQKMEVIGQMAGGLAHDFGNLVPPISMILHLLGKRHADDTRTRELIEEAEQSVERAGTLIRRLLTLSQPSRLDPEPQPAGRLLEQIEPLLRQVIGSRQFHLDIGPDLPMVGVDANQLDMALLNLVMNARDATDHTGRLALIAARTADGGVAITVVDDGGGMDADTLARATEPFYSTKASGQGSGLGLSMVHNFAVATGGRFVLHSDLGVGTRATIDLPAAEARRGG